jgi:cytochrome c-type biogenesis protein CcmH/NrfF
VRRIFVVLSLAVVVASCAGRTATPSDRAHAVEAQVWSPYCPGRLLIDCTTNQARALRTQIQQRVDRGDDPDEIIDWVRSEFGEEAIARPSGTGAGLVIWLVPLLLFLVGLAVVVRIARHAREPAAASDELPSA